MRDGILPYARCFAIAAHAGQQRKYTGEPYWHHSREVGELIAVNSPDGVLASAGWLHDVLEDTKVTEADLMAAFNSELLVQWVKEVTDVSRPEDGNRAARKALDREHLAKASPGGKTIKLADLISKSRSIVQHDPDFARVYLDEMSDLLPLLAPMVRNISGAHQVLYELAGIELARAQGALVQRALHEERVDR